MVDIWINFGISVILTAVKDPAKRAELKRAMLKVRNAINTAYAGDPDFES